MTEQQPQRLSAEREAYLRQEADDCSSTASSWLPELLAELDAVRDESKRHRQTLLNLQQWTQPGMYCIDPGYEEIIRRKARGGEITEEERYLYLNAILQELDRLRTAEIPPLRAELDAAREERDERNRTIAELQHENGNLTATAATWKLLADELTEREPKLAATIRRLANENRDLGLKLLDTKEAESDLAAANERVRALEAVLDAEHRHSSCAVCAEERLHRHYFCNVCTLLAQSDVREGT